VSDSQLTTSSNNDKKQNNNNDNNQEDIRYSTEFNWKKRQVIDENSVYRRPHVTIEFNRDHPEPVVSDIAESTIASSLKFYLIKETDDINSSLNNRVEASMEGSYAPSVINTESLSNIHDLESEAFEAPLVDGFESTDAVRSNYVSEYSTKQDERTIPLRFVRYRKAKKLSQYHVKGGIKLESRRGQINRGIKQKVIRMKEKKMNEDESFINAIH